MSEEHFGDRPSLRVAQASRADPRFTHLFQELDEIQSGNLDGRSFDRVCTVTATALRLLTTLAIETHEGRPYMRAWAARDVPTHRRASSEARAWSFFTLASIDRDSARFQAARAAELSPQFLAITLAAVDAHPPWFVQFESDVPFDSISAELLHHVAGVLRRVCKDDLHVIESVG